MTTQGNRSANKVAVAIIGAFTAFRLILMEVFGFGNDEAYTLAHVRDLKWSYFDHPPLQSWIAHVAEALLGTGSLVRLPFVLLFAVTGWLLFGLTRHLFGSRSALWALLALNLSGFFTLAAGGWVIPDGPLLMFLAAAAWQAAALLFPIPDCRQSSWRSWALVGLWVGLAGLSKYSAVFFPLGLACFVVLSPMHRFWLRHPAPYAGAIIVLALLSPVILWNSGNGWVSFLFQGGRSATDGSLHPLHVVTMVAGEIGLLLPWIAFPLIVAMVAMARRSHPEEPTRFLLWMAIPPIMGFTILPFWGAHGLPHWSMPGWFFGFPLLGAWLETRALWAGHARAWAIGCTAALSLLVLLVGSEARTGWIRLAMPGARHYGDPTLESFNWTDIAGRLRAGLGTSGQPNFVLARTWIDGGKIDQALGGTIPVMVFSDDPRQFAFDHDPKDFIGADALIVVDEAHADLEGRRLSGYFKRLGPPETIGIGRSGMTEVRRVMIPAYHLVATFPLPYPARTKPITRLVLQ